jgi:tetratricopeptide (TPR) repeat protein
MFTLALLTGCQTGPVAPAAPAADAGGVTAAAVTESAPAAAALEPWEAEFQRQRIIGDLLYDALRALQDDRLLTPVDDNAHQRYQRVLAFDPGNAQALEGLRNIVARYLELAADATRQGQFEAATNYLERARWVDPQDPAIAAAWADLQAEMNSGDLVFTLDGGHVARRTTEAQSTLADIARQAREQDAFLLITAPNDEQARWMFTVMRDAVDGYRLRGNIEIGNQAIIRLRVGRNENS